MVLRIMVSITVYLSDDEKFVKDLLKTLRKTQSDDNPYHGLSQSRIAARVLSRYLPEEQKRVLGQGAENAEGTK